MKSQAVVLNDFFNNKSFHKISLALLVLVSSLLTLIQPVFASKGGEMADNSRVIELKPDQIPAIKGGRIASFSLASVSGGRMNPIPFQFDERTKAGYIYMPDLDKKLKDDDPILGTEGFFDENDDLLFMLRDAGPRRKNGMATDGKILSEVELTGYDGAKRYIYIVEGARLESENYYVRYSSDLGRVETDYYALKVDPKNAFLWQEFYYDSFDGAHPRKPIDTIKIEMKANALGGVPQTLTNKNMVAKPIAEKSGPIRSTTQYKLQLVYLRVPMLNMKLQILHHENEIVYDSRTDIPKVRRRLVGKPSIKMSMDGYDLQGAEISVKGGPSQAGIVDGEISEIEKQMMETTINQNESNWLFMDSKYGFALFSNFHISTDDDVEVPMEVYLQDDLNVFDSNAEYYKGRSPNLGFGIPFIPLEGTLSIYVELKMYNEPLDIKVEDFANIINREIKVKAFKI